MPYLVECHRKDLIKFVAERKRITRDDLVWQFGYTLLGASVKLNRLKKEELIFNPVQGEWMLTDLGWRRFYYYVEQERKLRTRS
jgi:hypothetical protein